MRIGKYLARELGQDYCPFEIRRGCFDIFGGSSQPSGSTQTTISNRPIPVVEDALGRLIPQAEALAEIPVQQPDFDTVVPFSGQTEDALQLQEARALASLLGGGFTGTAPRPVGPTLGLGDFGQGGTTATAPQPIGPTFGPGDFGQGGTTAVAPQQAGPTFGPGDISQVRQTGFQGADLERAAIDAVLRTARGDFTQRRNPGFDQFAERLTGDIGSQINAQFAEAGRLKSPANAQALGRGIGDALSPLAFQDFQRERQNQLAAAELAPSLSAIDFRNIQSLRDVGSTRESQLGAEIQDELTRFNFAQREPRARIAEVLALIGGGQFGSNTTQTQPIFSNPTQQGIGNLAGLASIAGSLFGKDTVFR